jgi:hypothetical protein
VSAWDARRWQTGTPPPADLVFALVQTLADAGADTEGRSRRVVNRLESDLALPDQVQVMIADLRVAGAPQPVLDSLADLVRSTARALHLAVR